MNNFEKDYYESDRFWDGEAIQDEGNLNRFRVTGALIPDDVESLVDIGCGNGLFVNYMKTYRPELKLLAVDRSKTALKFVKTEKIEGDIISIPLSDHSYDCVSCLEVIEHLPVNVFKEALAELSRVANKYVLISVPYAEELEDNHTQCPQCKSIFNADLHMRNFSDIKMQHLLSSNGFECVGTKKEGERVSFKGHNRYIRIFYPNHVRQWRSPICPICGFQGDERLETNMQNNRDSGKVSNANRSFMSYFSWLPKLFWPKEKKYYWIICLYKRT